MTTYSVIQRNPNSWNASTGIHEIVNECGHKHKTVVAALRCLRTLAPNSEFGYFGRIGQNEGLPSRPWRKRGGCAAVQPGVSGVERKNAMKIPQGWKRRGHSAKSYHHEGEGLTVSRQFGWHGRDEKWRLFHNGKDTGHEFNTAKDAIEHAEDARIHGH